MRDTSCGVDVGGTRCTGDHSRLLHEHGNVYCAAVNSLSAPHETHSGKHVHGADVFDNVKENEDIVFYLQDIPAGKSKVAYRVFQQGTHLGGLCKREQPDLLEGDPLDRGSGRGGQGDAWLHLPVGHARHIWECQDYSRIWGAKDHVFSCA